ncbi:LysR family transcriptional regulator [Nocardioides sp. R1-1]|uniref:LysR family transcriptional regulator n=1 Tax=Nocardioides sp. R1-1 TaxID=3383502 RepID=UPI0038D1A887
MLSSARLAVIAQIAVHGSIAGAAEALHLTPSAVSHQLSRFEKEIGVALVERGPRSLRLTDAGRRMAEHAETIATMMREAQEEVTALGQGRAGRLRIGFFSSGGIRMVPLALSRFVAAHPQAELGLLPGQTHELLPLLEQGSLDVAVVFDHSVMPYPVPPNLEVTGLLSDPQRVVMPARHPKAQRSTVALGDLADVPWIATHGIPPTPPVLEKLCRDAGFVPEVRCRTDHYDVILGLVRAGLGVALVPVLGIPRTLEPGLALARIDGASVVRRISMVTRPGNPNPLVPEFGRALESAAATVQAELNGRTGTSPGE